MNESIECLMPVNGHSISEGINSVSFFYPDLGYFIIITEHNIRFWCRTRLKVFT